MTSSLYSPAGNFDDVTGWVVDTSLAVCLQVADWTAGFLDLTVASSKQLRISPTAYSREFLPQLNPQNLQLWDEIADRDTAILPDDFIGDEYPKVQAIIRESRRCGRAISRADAEGIYLARLHNFVLLTGDYRQARIANSNGVNVVHKFTVLERMANDGILPTPRLCAGLMQLIDYSHTNGPCALSDDQRNRLQEIYRQQCLANAA